MKKKLIIISDLNGTIQSDWISSYFSKLSPFFDLKFYSSIELAEIENTNLTPEELHKKIIQGGIDKAVQNLIKKEDNAVIVGFSIGGTIAWKANLHGLNSDALYIISSTRIRYETQKPKTRIQLFYGEKDSFKPNEEWFSTLKISPIRFFNEIHECYKKPEICEFICSTILKEIR